MVILWYHLSMIVLSLFTCGHFVVSFKCDCTFIYSLMVILWYHLSVIVLLWQRFTISALILPPVIVLLAECMFHTGTVFTCVFSQCLVS